jgi:hypothetical protein
VPPEPGRWQLESFLDHLDVWIEREQPSDDLRLIVTAWVLTRYEDPYQGVQREPGFENLWFGEIPARAMTRRRQLLVLTGSMRARVLSGATASQLCPCLSDGASV